MEKSLVFFSSQRTCDHDHDQKRKKKDDYLYL